MALFGNKPKTAQQKSQWAKSRLILRGACLVFIVFYVIFPLMNPAPEDADAMNPTLRYIIVAVFIVIVAAFTVLTVLEYFRYKKAGLYEAEGYKDDEGAGVAPEAAGENDDDYDDDDEYEDDEDYDDEEYEEINESNEEKEDEEYKDE
jgi:flagellar biosynthesis/type III secretory pathway M-ring protein FliF/YscJ